MSIDLNSLRSIVTLVSLLLFIGLMVWTWSRRRQSAFDEAAQLPFLDDDAPGSTSTHK
ncbi:cbb3-type cytochrome oxidase subunit 3 [Ideonella oryzae]|uniref:CcoQ/FixQ family Cbb3-type cytochrome c oxidase assembly chaperone n=1 Tax=Ideonella oryzae TaxID=2937441 RepID=A0ABT1BSH0_9BURK|nr:CcoQ/FixQ family Cbb3-type cytochrome c oxidase assembly chaperone [Ideonella oryzae]MCO5979190.1 CcoQ/FixQ family Cbb3-type cytochrome c oxidase assembly chaperone [Ideonella oryzae]